MATTATGGGATGPGAPSTTSGTGTAATNLRMDGGNIHHNTMHGGGGVGGIGVPALQHQLASLLDTAQRLLAESTGVSGYTQDYGKIAAAPQPAVYTLMAMQVLFIHSL